MATRRLELGPVGRRLARNLAALRMARQSNQPQLARLVAQLGRPMTGPVLSKTEQLDRRVDVDDLVALAVALGATPNRLLLGPRRDDSQIELTPNLAVSADRAWLWAGGEEPLPIPMPGFPEPGSPAWLEYRSRFRAENRPWGHAWDFFADPALTGADRQAAEARSVMGALLAAINNGVKVEALHKLVDAAAAAVNGDAQETGGE
jgi:hypothetical protein